MTGVTGPWSFHEARGSVGGLHDDAGLGAMLRGGQEPRRPSPALARSHSWYRPEMSDSADHPGVSGCYAAELGDCSGRLSGEHWISAAVLRLLAEPAGVSIRGAPWLDGEVRAVPIRKLKANILCKGHNERLSWLDELAPVWARKLGVGVDANFADTPPGVITGHGIELWLLKLLCGLGVSGNMGRDGVAVKGWRPPAQWLRILFGRADFVPGAGLYAMKVAPRDIGSYLVATAYEGTRGPAGVMVEVPGHALLLSCEEPPPANIQGASYRPLVLGDALIWWRSRGRGPRWARWVREVVRAAPVSATPSRRARRGARLACALACASAALEP